MSYQKPIRYVSVLLVDPLVDKESSRMPPVAEVYEALAPSNIALLKYWGKSQDHPDVWPAHSSLSMTLQACHTCTSVRRITNDFKASALESEGIEKVGSDMVKIASEILYLPGARKRLKDHLAMIRAELGMGCYESPLYIESANTFPAHCGLASSASGYMALTAGVLGCLLEAGSLLALAECGYDMSRVAGLARRGSGSACRSAYGGYVVWDRGESPDKQDIIALHSHDVLPLANSIVVFSHTSKKVSSRQGHKSAFSSPLFARRMADSTYRMRLMDKAIKCGDFSQLGYLAEIDAIEMHAVMMTSKPPLYYFSQNTEKFMAWLAQQRQRGVFEAYMTLDAGPNIHVLSRLKDRECVSREIKKVTEKFNIEVIISDQTGIEGLSLSSHRVDDSTVITC